MKFFYLDKKDRIRVWWTPRRSVAVAVAVMLALLLPVWRETTEGPFLLEPGERAVIRSVMTGMVAGIYADEGAAVNAGQPVARLRSLKLESQLAQSRADYQVADARADSAMMRYADAGAASQERERLAKQTKNLTAEAENLELVSPISGVVLTPRASDRTGTYVDEGTELLEIADLSHLRARLYVSEHDMFKLRPNSPGRIQVAGMFGTRPVQTVAISPRASQIAPGLIDVSQYQGLRAPNFYLVDLLVDNSDGSLKPGMNGIARLYGGRKSLAAMAWQAITNFVGRKMW